MKPSTVLFICLCCLCISSAHAVDKDHLLTGTSVGHAKLGMPFRKFISYFKYDSLKNEETGLSLFYQGKILVNVSDKKWGTDKITRLVVLYSDSFSTADGVRIGMPIKSFLRKYPRQSLFTYEGYHFAPGQLQTDSTLFFLYPVFSEHFPDSFQVTLPESIADYPRVGYIGAIQILFSGMNK